MKTILQILPSLDKINGGVERGTLDIARELAERKFNSVIISSGGEMADRYKYKGVSHHKIEINKKGLINSLNVIKLHLNQQIKEIDDIIKSFDK